MPKLDPTKYPIAFREPAGGEGQYPVVVLLHGNFGMAPDYAARMLCFAEAVADLGYIAAVPRYYPDENPHPTDGDPKQHVAVFAAAIDEILSRPDVAPGRIAIVGYSLGGGVAMSWMAEGEAGRVAAFIDFFGFAPADLPGNLAFPPTAIFHNRADAIVPFRISLELVAKLKPDVPLRIEGFVEQDDPAGMNHVFAEGGPAEVEAEAMALDWLRKYLPPAKP